MSTPHAALSREGREDIIGRVGTLGLADEQYETPKQPSSRPAPSTGDSYPVISTPGIRGTPLSPFVSGEGVFWTNEAQPLHTPFNPNVTANDGHSLSYAGQPLFNFMPSNALLMGGISSIGETYGAQQQDTRYANGLQQQYHGVHNGIAQAPIARTVPSSSDTMYRPSHLHNQTFPHLALQEQAQSTAVAHYAYHGGRPVYWMQAPSHGIYTGGDVKRNEQVSQ